MSHEEGIMLVNAVAGALGHYAWVPEIVLKAAMDRVPEMDMHTLRMMKRMMIACEWHMGCLYSLRKCAQTAEDLLSAVSAKISELEEKRKETDNEDQQNQGAVQA